MKVTAIKTFICNAFRTNFVFVKVETDSGLFNKVARFFGGEGIAYYSTPGAKQP